MYKTIFGVIVFSVTVFGLFCGVPQSSYAEIEYLKMKGVHDLIRPEYEYLSPIYGFTLLATKALENRRFYGNYGPKKEGFDCLEKASRIHELLIKNNDCPQDATAELIQRLFPSQDRVSFVPNQVDSDPVSHLNPSTIGKVLGIISKVVDSDLLSDSIHNEEDKGEAVKKLTSDLQDVLFESLNPKKYRNQKLAALQRNKKKYALEESFENQKKLNQQIAFLQEMNVKTGRGDLKDFEALANLIVQSLKETRGFSDQYPKHLTEHALLAFFWKKGNEKQDFLRLFKGMSHVLKDAHFFNDYVKQTSFLEKQYFSSDFDPSSVARNPEKVATNLIEHPEILVFYAQQENIIHKPLPLMLSPDAVGHSSISDSLFKKYADCGETSVRNFLNIILYNQKNTKFDIGYLLQENSTLRIYPNLISFYKKYSDSAKGLSKQARDEWSELVASNHEGVVYKMPPEEPQCEITSLGSGGFGFDNIMNLLDRLLYYGEVKEPSPMTQAKGRAAQLDLLCQVLSRDGFRLSWNIIGNSNFNFKYKIKNKSKINDLEIDIDVEFSINNKPSFIWQFRPHHFILQDIQETQESWIDPVAEQMIPFVFKAENPPSLALLNWFSSSKAWDKMEYSTQAKHHADPYRVFQVVQNLIYGLPLSREDGKLGAFKKIIANNLTFLFPLAKRLKDRLSVDNGSKLLQINAILSNYDYPLGDPEHAIGKPQVKYTRVTDSALLVKLGRAWKDEKTGLIWGDIVKGKNDAIYMMDQSDAERYCHLIGARLPRREDFEKLAKDLGYPTDYIPQFLPDLYKNWFWLSSIRLGNFDNALAYNGEYGFVVKKPRSEYNSVRCVLSLGD